MSRKCRRPIEWFGRVLGGINRAKQGKTGLAPNSWKYASLQNVSQTDALALRDSQELNTVLNSIGTGILEICECPESVADREMVKGGSYMFKSGITLIGT